jgi:MinD superfamily P-loop ATPase
MSSKIEEYCTQNNIEVVGKFPFDPLVVEAMVNCQSITDFAPDADISKLIKKSYQKLF